MIKHILSKWGILSAELISAMDADNTVINEDGTKSYVETEEYNEPIKAEVIETEPAETSAQDALFAE